jgi:DNA-binding transcriptional MerR regulator
MNIKEIRKALAALNDENMAEILKLSDDQLARLKELMTG